MRGHASAETTVTRLELEDHDTAVGAAEVAIKHPTWRVGEWDRESTTLDHEDRALVRGLVIGRGWVRGLLSCG